MALTNKTLSNLLLNKPTNICFPLIYVAPQGIISIVLPFDTVIDIAVDKTIRIVCFDKFCIASNSKGTKNAILHSNAQIYHDDEKVYSNFFSDIKKTAVIGAQGILFTMDYLKDAYLVSANAVRGILSKESIQFLNLDFDFALRLFYTEAECGENYTNLCNEIVQHAHYEEKDGFLTILINGLNIIQKKNGDIEIKSRPRHITCSPSTGSIHIKTINIGLGIENSEKGYVKRSTKRVHVSRSGMVVSDGYYTTSMDHFGRIISAT